MHCRNKQIMALPVLFVFLISSINPFSNPYSAPAARLQYLNFFHVTVYLIHFLQNLEQLFLPIILSHCIGRNAITQTSLL